MDWESSMPKYEPKFLLRIGICINALGFMHHRESTASTSAITTQKDGIYHMI